MKIRRLLVIMLAVATVRGVEAPKTADEIMKFATAKTDEYKTWSAELRQGISLMGMPMTLQGQTWFKSPRFTRTEMQMPMVGALGKMTIVMGGDGIMWQEMDVLGQKKVMKMNMNQLAGNLTGQSGGKIEDLPNLDPARQWENSRQFMDFTLIPGATIENQPMWVLEGKWKAAAAANPVLAQQVGAISKMRLHVGQRDGFTHRIEQFDKSGNKPSVTIDFTKIKFNEKLNDAMFQYKPPSGIEAVDITDMTAQMIQQGGNKPPTPPR